jgi:TatA/E family protein of Tat protein translocase
MHSLLFFEFLGTSELMVVLFVALVVFGPRKLPEMGRSLGKALHQFRSASNDFKRVWEMEAMMETGGAAALTPATSVEQDATEEAHAELVPGNAAASADEEAHASPHEALVPIGTSHSVPAAALVEG